MCWNDTETFDPDLSVKGLGGLPVRLSDQGFLFLHSKKYFGLIFKLLFWTCYLGIFRAVLADFLMLPSLVLFVEGHAASKRNLGQNGHNRSHSEPPVGLGDFPMILGSF